MCSLLLLFLGSEDRKQSCELRKNTNSSPFSFSSFASPICHIQRMNELLALRHRRFQLRLRHAVPSAVAANLSKTNRVLMEPHRRAVFTNSREELRKVFRRDALQLRVLLFNSNVAGLLKAAAGLFNSPEQLMGDTHRQQRLRLAAGGGGGGGTAVSASSIPTAIFDASLTSQVADDVEASLRKRQRLPRFTKVAVDDRNVAANTALCGRVVGGISGRERTIKVL